MHAQENIIFENENDYNNKKNNASYLYKDFYEIKIQKTLTSKDINSDYFDKSIHKAKHDILEELSNFDLNQDNIDFYILIKKNVENKKISIFVTFFVYCTPIFSQHFSFIKIVSQSTQNLIFTALHKLNF